MSEKLYNAFLDGTITDDQYDLLKKRTKYLNSDSVTDDEISDIKQGMVNSFRHTVMINNNDKLSSYLQPKKDNKIDSIQNELLFSQFIDISPIRSKLNRKSQFIIHNLEYDSIDYEKLYQWTVFNDITELIMNPIYYMISQFINEKKTRKSENNIGIISSKSNKNNINKKITSKIEFQQRISKSIDSTEGGGITLNNIINIFEDITGSLFKKLLLHDSKIILIFEWIEEYSFMFMLCFNIINTKWLFKEYDYKSILSLHRNDILTEYVLNEDVNNYEVQTTINNNNNNTININPSYNNGLNQLFSFNNNNNTVNDKDMNKNPINDITTFYGDRMNMIFLIKLKEELLSYIGYGYIKRED